MPPTTTGSIYRGSTVDAYGDTTDDNSAPLHTDIPAILGGYKNVTVQDPASGTPRQVKAVPALFGKGTDIQPDDRFQDSQTGLIYEVTEVLPMPSYGIPADISVTLWLVGTG